MRIKKAVITAAGQNQRTLPLQTVIDRDGREKSVLGILIEQALTADVEQICVVVWPGDEKRYAQVAGTHGGAVRFVAQPQPLGYGHAIWCAREFVGRDAFLHMVGDHLYVSTSTPCAQRLVELAGAEECSVSGVQPTRKPAAALRHGGGEATAPGTLPKGSGNSVKRWLKRGILGLKPLWLLRSAFYA